MEEQAVEFKSGGLRIAGRMARPTDMHTGERRPAFIVLHGFGSNKNGTHVRLPYTFLSEQGYVTLRFDMRGCGESEGEPGRVICLDQVEDTRNALTFLQHQPGVDPDRIALIGASFGAAVAIYAAGVDARIAGVVSSGGWGDGERKFRGQHAGPQAWQRFTDMLSEGRRHRERTGRSLMVSRFDIVPMPEELRRHMAPGSVMQFPAETAQSMFDFRADDMIGKIAPRPVLLLHSATDTVTPTEQSIELFKRAGSPTDLHLFAETDHFMFAADNTRVRKVMVDWLEKYFPVGVGG